MPLTEDVFRTSVLPFTLKEEGGLSLDRNDAGNWTGGKVGAGTLAGTKYGIAASAHPGLDIRGLTLAQACDIYWADYMVAPGFTALEPGLAMVVFDCGVNCGTGRAKALLAPILGRGSPAEQVVAFTAANLAFHERLKTWPRYGAVWGRRIAACQVVAAHLVAGSPVPEVSPLPDAATPRAAPKAAVQPTVSIVTLLLRCLFALFGTPAPAAA